MKEGRKAFIPLLVLASLALGIGITLVFQAVARNGSLTTKYAQFYERVFAGKDDCLRGTQFAPRHGALVNVVPWGKLGGQLLIVSSLVARAEQPSALYFQVSGSGPTLMAIASSQTEQFLERNHCRGVTHQICAAKGTDCY